MKIFETMICNMTDDHATGAVICEPHTPPTNVTIIESCLADALRWREFGNAEDDAEYNALHEDDFVVAIRMNDGKPCIPFVNRQHMMSTVTARATHWRKLADGIDTPSAEVGT